MNGKLNKLELPESAECSVPLQYFNTVKEFCIVLASDLLM